MSRIKKEHKKIVDGTMATIRELWLKGIPIKTPVFTFFSYRNQHVVIKFGNKKRKYPYYDVIFDVSKTPLSNQRGKANMIKMFRMNKRQIKALIAIINKEQKTCK